jgi:XTP/dITP diphosphohydrolase
MQNTISDSFLRLVSIMDDLREKCPWDKKQTIATLRQLTIEETFELADAITEENWKGIKEELGDLMLHLLFYTKIGTEQQQFTLTDMLDAIAEKLIHRHPHIYGDVTVKNEDDVKRNWEKLKLKEGKTSVLSGVPRSLPAMVKAMRLQEKAKQVGFEWDNREQVWEKVEEEMRELQEAIGNRESVVRSSEQYQTPDAELRTLNSKIEDEFGDLIFSLINYARFLQIDAENSLERTNKKFISRFTAMEQMAMQEEKPLYDMTLEEMDKLWNIVKKQKQAD